MIYTLKKLDLNAGITDIDIQLYDAKQDPWLGLVQELPDIKMKRSPSSPMRDCVKVHRKPFIGVNMVTHNEKVIGMLFTLTGDDACADRKNNINDQFIWNVDP